MACRFLPSRILWCRFAVAENGRWLRSFYFINFFVKVSGYILHNPMVLRSPYCKQPLFYARYICLAERNRRAIRVWTGIIVGCDLIFQLPHNQFGLFHTKILVLFFSDIKPAQFKMYIRRKIVVVQTCF